MAAIPTNGEGCFHYLFSSIYVTSFSSISYCNKNGYWTQKRTQNESIHSIKLDVHVLKAERHYMTPPTSTTPITPTLRKVGNGY